MTLAFPKPVRAPKEPRGGFLQRHAPLRARKPLDRGAPLERKTPMKRGGGIRRKPRPELAPDDLAYVLFIHGEPCVGIADFPGHTCWSPDDEDPIDASHVGPRHERAGTGLKGPWRRTIPKCRRLHIQFGANAGPFKSWDRERLRAWGMKHVERLNAKFDALTPGAPPIATEDSLP